MLEKKSAKGDLDARKFTFVLIGFVFVLALVYVSFELFASQPANDIAVAIEEDVLVVHEEDVLSTDQTPPPPPPQQQQQQQETVINIVNNMIQVTTNIDFGQDVDQNTSIEAYEPIDLVTEVVEVAPPLRFAEKQPEFPGGMEAFYAALRNELKYPEPAKIAGVQGYVVVEFIVETDGRLSNLNVTNKLFPACDEEAVRALKLMPNWTPAEQMNKKVRCYFQIPIKFTLQ